MPSERLGGRQMRQGLPDEPRVAYNESYVAAELDFEELVVALPLTHWWQEHVWRTKADRACRDARDPAVEARRCAARRRRCVRLRRRRLARPPVVDAGRRQDRGGAARPAGEDRADERAARGSRARPRRGRRRRGRLPGAAARPQPSGEGGDLPLDPRGQGRRGDEALRPELPRAAVGRGRQRDRRDAPRVPKRDEKGHLLPEPFGKPKRGAAAQNNTRIVATYDFTRLRRLLSPDAKDDDATLTREERSRVADFRRALKAGARSTGSRWSRCSGSRTSPERTSPGHEHGTHVAGILTADWKVTDEGARTTRT